MQYYRGSKIQMFKAHNTNYITDSYVNTVYVLQIRVIRELR